MDLDLDLVLDLDVVLVRWAFTPSPVWTETVPDQVQVEVQDQV